MKQDLFTILINRYLAGKASAEEVAMLEDYYEKIAAKFSVVDEVAEPDILQAALLQKLQEKINATGKNKPQRFVFIGKRLAAAAVVLLASLIVIWFSYKKPAVGTQPIALHQSVITTKAVAYYTIRNAGSQAMDTVLSDGTKVWLNKNTTLTYPGIFSDTERKVRLVGEAYFEVMHLAKQPFRVIAGSDMIEDVGTRFNIKALPGQYSSTVTVLEGAVSVNAKKLVAGQQYAADQITNVKPERSIAWKEGFDKNEVIVFHQFPETVKVNFDKFLAMPDNKVADLYSIDSNLLIRFYQPVNGYFFHRYSTATKQPNGVYVNGGRQSLQVASFAGISDNKVAWVYDFSSQTIMTDSLVHKDKGVRYEMHHLEREYYIIQLLDTHTILGTESWGRDPAKIYEEDLEKKHQTVSYGSFTTTPEGTPFEVWKEAHESFLFLQPGGNKVATAARFTDQVEMFDLHTHKSKVLKGPENYAAEYDVMTSYDRQVLKRNEKTRIAFQNGGAVTKKFLYLLYSGNYEELHYDPNSQTRQAGKYVFVYDWDGHPVKKINLGRFVTSITVSENDEILYASDKISGYIVKAKL